MAAGGPGDPLLRALAEHWDDVAARADDDQRDRLISLVENAESDPDGARVAIADELVDILPPEHPLAVVLGSTTMFSPGGPGPAAARQETLAADFRALRARVRGEPPPVAEPPGEDGPGAAAASGPQPSAAPDEARRDPLLRALATYWDDVRRLASAEQYARLVRLIDGTDEPDALAARTAIEDELVDIVPASHPLAAILGSTTELGTGVADALAAEAAERALTTGELRWLAAFVVGGEAGSGPAPSPSPTGAPAGSAIAPGDPPTAEPRPGAGVPDDPVAAIIRAVQARLLRLPALSAADVGARRADVADRWLIRLARPGLAPQFPAFQFDGDGGPYPVVREINRRLAADVDPWGVTCWWVDPHAVLEVAPADLLGKGRDRLLLRAAIEVGR